MYSIYWKIIIKDNHINHYFTKLEFNLIISCLLRIYDIKDEKIIFNQSCETRIIITKKIYVNN